MSGGAARKTIRVLEEQRELLKQLRRGPWEPIHAVLQRILDCYMKCREYCEQREKADFDVV